MDARAGLGRQGLHVLAGAGTLLVVAAVASMLARGRPLEALYARWILHNGPPAVVMLWMGALVVRRLPRHGAGLVLVVCGGVAALHTAVAALVDARLLGVGVDDLAGDMAVPADLPLDVAIPIWLMAWLWVPIPVLLTTLLLQVFPDGELPGGRWRWTTVAAVGGGLLLLLAHAIVAWPTATTPLLPGNLPVTERPVPLALAVTGGVAVLAAAGGSVGVLIGRWRRAEGERRRPFRLVGTVAVVFAVVGTVLWPWQPLWQPAILVGLVVLLATYALAVVRYRLHDIDVVISRAAVGAILAVGVTGVYVAIVVGVGSLVTLRGESTLLPLLAIGAVAVLVEPGRRQARRLVDRLLYGRDTDRAAVLARLAERAGTATRAEDVIGDVVDLLVRSTGAQRAEVWLDRDGRFELAGTAGSQPTGSPCLRAPVVHHDECLGELLLYARHRAHLVDDAEELVGDVARSLGVFLRNVRLTAELQEQLTELRRSRQRLVEVHDEVRRGVERDLHDGAQARLIGLRLRLGALQTSVTSDVDGPAIAEQLNALGDEVDAAVQSLRELARGLHPALLEQSGVVAALRAGARSLRLPVAIDATEVGRYGQQVEAAVYFSCLEALQNAARHAQATRVEVSLRDGGGSLRFAVVDDGVGFDPSELDQGCGLANVEDRLAALGGRLEVRSRPGEGTWVVGEVPAAQVSDSAR